MARRWSVRSVVTGLRRASPSGARSASPRTSARAGRGTGPSAAGGSGACRRVVGRGPRHDEQGDVLHGPVAVDFDDGVDGHVHDAVGGAPHHLGQRGPPRGGGPAVDLHGPVLGERGREALGVTVVETSVVASRQLTDLGPVDQPRHRLVHEVCPLRPGRRHRCARRSVRHRPGRRRRYPPRPFSDMGVRVAVSGATAPSKVRRRRREPAGASTRWLILVVGLVGSPSGAPRPSGVRQVSVTTWAARTRRWR